MEKQNEAVNVLEKLGVKIKNHVVFNIAGIDFRFNLDPAAYDAFFNEVEAKNKVTPMRDYLLSIVEQSQRNALAELLRVPGFTPELMGKVQEHLIPQIDITVKN